MSVSIHRYARAQEPGDLTRDDLITIWGLLKAEGLVEIFFHDGGIATLNAFLRSAMAPELWFYAARRKGEFIGLGMINGFSSSGNTAYAHLVSFACGREGSFREAGRLWFDGLARAGIETLIAVLPACYRGARRFAQDFDFKEQLRLPGALHLARGGKGRTTDAVVLLKDLRTLTRQQSSDGNKE